jgi:CBS domain-containing protein
MVHLALSTRSIAPDDPEMARRISEMGKERERVADVMIADAIVVSVDATLDEADSITRSTLVNGLPVVDGDGADRRARPNRAARSPQRRGRA